MRESRPWRVMVFVCGLFVGCGGGGDGPDPTCSDGVRNQGEEDVDCGGPCPACHQCGCLVDSDCSLGAICEDCACLGHCDDDTLNGDETDLDCGGSCQPCADGQACLVDADCLGEWCDELVCSAPIDHCTDGVQNNGETDIDCGGPCPDCPDPCGCIMDEDCLPDAVCIACMCVAADHSTCACVTGGDNTGDGYASDVCRSAGLPFQPQVHFCEDFNTDAYAGQDGIVGEILFPNWDGPCDHSWEPHGGFWGGAARFTAHTFDGEQSDGLFIPWPEEIATAAQGNIGYLLYMGPDWNDSLATNQEWKHTLLRTNDVNGQTAMLMDWVGAKHAWSACSMMAGVCQDEFGDQYPQDANPHSFVPPDHAGEWVYVELEHIPGPQGSVNVYVYTRQGNVVGAGPMATIPSAASTPHVFNNARILAYMEGACNAAGDRQSVIPVCTADSYAKIDLVRLGDAFIGPPAGFVE